MSAPIALGPVTDSIVDARGNATAMAITHNANVIHLLRRSAGNVNSARMIGPFVSN